MYCISPPWSVTSRGRTEGGKSTSLGGGVVEHRLRRAKADPLVDGPCVVGARSEEDELRALRCCVPGGRRGHHAADALVPDTLEDADSRHLGQAVLRRCRRRDRYRLAAEQAEQPRPRAGAA